MTSTATQIPTPARRAWTPPTSELRGSIAELVQICKSSGKKDSYGCRTPRQWSDHDDD